MLLLYAAVCVWSRIKRQTDDRQTVWLPLPPDEGRGRKKWIRKDAQLKVDTGAHCSITGKLEQKGDQQRHAILCSRSISGRSETRERDCVCDAQGGDADQAQPAFHESGQTVHRLAGLWRNSTDRQADLGEENGNHTHAESRSEAS